MKKRLLNYFRAGFPGIAIQTAEEQRAIADVIAAAEENTQGVAVWSATEGLAWLKPVAKKVDQTEDLLAATGQRLKNAVIIFRDVQTWPIDRDPILNRSIRDILAWAPTERSCIVFVGPSFKPTPTFEKMIVVTDYTLPSEADLKKIADGIAKSASKDGKGSFDGNRDILRALSGLSTTEAENALALSLIETTKFDSDVIYREKIAGVKKSGLLEIVNPDPAGLAAIGGLDSLKAWITKRKKAYTPEAEAFGLPSPKGILLVGVPGTGKSLSAKAIGTALGVPTIRLDIGALFNSLVGESEARTRDALALAEALSPCVLWVDEIDKGLAGSSGSGANDSGVTKRVFGTVISWMQERRRPVFLVATANDVTALPPEFLRKGRFDEIFAVDLPNETERREIFGIHLQKRKRTKLFEKMNGKAVDLTQNFTGSEIEALIEEALFNAFDEGRDITEADLIAAAKDTQPLAVTAKEKVDAIRSWAQSKARWASSRIEPQTTPKRRVIG